MLTEVNEETKLALSTLEIFDGILICRVWGLEVIVAFWALGLCVGVSRATLRVKVLNWTHAIFAVIITLPVGELTVMPAPGVLLIVETAAPSEAA